MEPEYQLHPWGFLMEPAAFGNNFFRRPEMLLLGSGATGEVSRRWKQIEGKFYPYAVKQSYAGRANSISYIREEAVNLAALWGLPGVLQGEGVVYATGERVCIVSELIDGPNLDRVVRDRAQTPYAALWVHSVASQLCKAIQAMHDRQSAWLDGKPVNVLCAGYLASPSLRITLCDFAGSYNFDCGPEVCINEVAGDGNTPDYMPPEMVVAAHLVQDCEDLDDLNGIMCNVIAADAWAAGAIIYFAATGSKIVSDGPKFLDGTEAEFHIARLAHLQEVHTRWKESGMGEVWARLGEATHNDEPLITFVQQLLTLDPEPRARFGELVRTHPYLQPAPQPVSVGQAPSLAAIPTPLAAGAVAPTPLQVASRPNVDKVVVEQLRPLPGLPSVLWHPASVAVCQMSSGSVYRAWSLLETGDWQQCLVKHLALYPARTAEGKTLPIGPLHDSLQADASGTAADRAGAINASVDAVNKFRGNLGVPYVQYAFADGHHFTLYKVFGSSVMTLQEYLERTAAGKSVPMIDLVTFAVKLLRVLKGLHVNGHYLGALRPERILVQPDFYLLDFAPGDWVEDVYGLQSTCPYQQMRCHKKGMSQLESCSSSADMWSLGNLLALFALGDMPFPGDLDLVPDAEILEEEQLTEFCGSVIRQLVDPTRREQLKQQLTEKVGPEITHLVLQLLQQKPTQRLSAAEALQLPCCATVLLQQQQQQTGAGPGNDTSGSTDETVQLHGQDECSRKRSRADQNAGAHTAGSGADGASVPDSADRQGVHNGPTTADSSADSSKISGDGVMQLTLKDGDDICAHQALDDPSKQQDAGRSRRPWWGAPLCSVARAAGTAGGWMHRQLESHPRVTTAVAVTGCAALACLAHRRQR